ncbi:hypothetical protein FRC10_011115 [Ceratobasidium sp. 414]|nr:hypothetical protein FRC10_011115 [Ceratobasidium sp. 414]
MVGDTVKSEFPLDSKVESVITPELRAELAHMVQAAMSQMRAECTQSNLKPGSAQAERQVLNETTATLEAELAAARKQVQDACIVLNSFKSELDTQSASYAAKVQQFEQKIAALSEQEASLRAMNAQLCADRDIATKREQQLVLSKDHLAARNIQLSSKLTDMECEYSLKVAHLNDAVYLRNQVEERLLQATKENEYWRQYYASSTSTPTPTSTSTSTSQGQPPPTAHFSIPRMPNRRNTAPDISAAPPQYMSFRQSNPTGPHSQKRPRVDSASSSVSVDAANTLRVSSGSEAFKLRPVRPLFSHGALRGSQSSTISQPGQATSPTSVALPLPSAPAPPILPAPAPPAVIRPEPASQPPALSPSKPQLSPVDQPAEGAILAPGTVPPHVQQLLRQLFPVSTTGQRECKLCK